MGFYFHQIETDSQQQRRSTFKRLHEDLNNDPAKVKLEQRFYIKFNQPRDHMHPSKTRLPPVGKLIGVSHRANHKLLFTQHGLH